MVEVVQNRGKEKREKAGDRPVKADQWTYKYIEQLSKKQDKTMKDTLKRICREHMENTAPALERAIGKIDEAMDEVNGENARFLSLCKLGLRNTAEGNGEIVKTLRDTIKQVDRIEQMLEVEAEEEE